MEETKKNKSKGFRSGLQKVYESRPAAEYACCLKEVREVCQTTEERGNSRTTFYNKMNGRSPLTIAEASRLSEVFARYGVTDWLDD